MSGFSLPIPDEYRYRQLDTRSRRTVKITRLRRVLCAMFITAIITSLGFAITLGIVNANLKRDLRAAFPNHQSKPVVIAVIGADASRLRADLIYLVVISPRHHRVAMVQVPRDACVHRAGKPRKINSLLQLGPQRLGALVGNLTSLTPSRYFLMDFNSAVAVLEALCPRGITVSLPDAVDMTFSRSEGAHRLVVPEGPSKVTPTDFFYLARLRQSATDTSRKDGDAAARLPRQAQLLRALLDQIKQDKDLRLPSRLKRVVDSELDTDLTESEITALAWSMRGMQASDLRITPAPGSAGRRGMYYLDKTQLAIETESLAAWVMCKPHVPVMILQQGDGSPRVQAAIRTAGEALRVRTRPVPPIRYSWISYSKGHSSEETGEYRRVAADLAHELGMSRPFLETNRCGITLAVGQDLQRGGKS